jgi:diguanylate cyclase (GGDEF)-like protein/PAS domain S-box-containing protein
MPSRSRLLQARRSVARWLRSLRGPHQTSLRTTIAILRAQQEATLDGILVVDPQGRVLTFNKRFLEIWGISPGTDDKTLLDHAADQIANWGEFITNVNEIYEDREAVRKDDRILLKDGRTLSRTTVPVISAGGEYKGRAWYFRDVTDTVRNDNVQRALFRISELSRTSGDLASFYKAIHEVMRSLMEATNFYIAEYDLATDIVSFPHFADQYDSPPSTRRLGRGLTTYVLRTGKPLLARPEDYERLIAQGEIDALGTKPVDWMGAPLKTGTNTWGVLAVQSYDPAKRYSDRDREILVFVAAHVASAIEQKRQQTNLHESERRYRQMFEGNRAVQLSIDPETGQIIDANAAAAEFYGWSVDELRKMSIWDINPLGEQTLRNEMISAAQQDRTYFTFQHRTKDGRIRDVEVHSGPVEVGGRTILYSIIHDITERRETERALAASEEKFRTMFNSASVGIYQAMLEGQLVTANLTFARLLGYDSIEEVLTKSMATDVYFNPAERKAVIERFAPNAYAADVELLWKRKDGSPVWVQLNCHSLRNAAGEMLLEGYVTDVTERKRAEQQVMAANTQRKAVLDAATRISVIASDAEGIITVFNSGAERLLGYTPEEMIGKRSILELHSPDELEAHAADLLMQYGERLSAFDVLAHRAERDGLEEREWTYLKKDGTPVTVLLSVTALRREDGWLTGFLHVANDVTERKQVEAMLRRQSAAMSASMDGIGIVNEKLEFTFVNDGLAKLYGYANLQSMIGMCLPDLYEASTNERFTNTILPIVAQRGRWRGEATGLRRDGLTFPQEISITSIEGGGLVIVVRDITERTYAEEQIKHLAYHDALTALPNRLLFKDRLTVAISHAQRERSKLAVLFLDLDRFKVINDSLGHNIGDHLLQSVAARVQSCLRDSDTVARLGGDEFTLLLPSLSVAEDAAVVAQKILDAVRYPFHVEGRELFVTTSIGISLYPDDGQDAEALIKNADTAMYQAKEQGRDNYQLFNAFINAKALQRIALEHGLRKALANQELSVHYQPIFDFRLNRITGMEALLRWNHPTMGMIPPAVFIPLAEAIGVMVPLGTWAMRTACVQAKEWHDAGFRGLTLAVNLAVCQLTQPDLLERVREVLDETGLPPRLLELEITESSAMQNPEQSMRTLYDLKKIGLRISLDDFGTGHSSLSYIKRFPIDTLKIDQSFVRDITSDPDTAAIVIAIIAMAHSLRLKVIAEGVEFAEQANFLKRNGCDQMQGYLIKAPVPADKFLALVEAAADPLVR